jgi:DNA polymerase-3 subunit alpha
VSFSDPTGMFEIMLFPEVLAASRPLLEAGKSLLINCSVEWDGDDLKLRAASILDLDQAAAQAGEGMVVRLSDTSALSALNAELQQAGKGLVNIVVPAGAGEEVEIELKKRIAVTATLRNRISALSGVTSVEAV